MLDETIHLALDTIRKNKQALVFAPSRASAEKTAEDISNQTKLLFPELSSQILKSSSSPTKQCRRLANCIKKGIAFHHAGLTGKQKELIEQEFRKGSIRIVCCTPTLAIGMSLPAFRVILKSLKRYSGRRGMDWIPVLEYHQMAGRAGRPEYEPYGEALTIAKTTSEKEAIHERYICGRPEQIYSKLAVEPVFRTYLLSLIAADITRTKQQIKEFFSKTFWAFQFKDTEKLELLIEKMLLLLEEYEFIIISRKESDFTPASDLQADARIRATLLGKRVSELYLDPFTAHHLLNCLKRSSSKEIELSSFSFIQMFCHTLEMLPLLRVKAKDHEHVQERLAERYGQLLEDEPTLYDFNYDDFLNSIKTALFFEEWIEEKDEDYLLEKYGIPPGEVHTKLDLADWLLYSSHELARIIHLQGSLNELSKLRFRIKYGVKEELLPLLRLKGIGRKRARKLYNNKIKDIGDVKKTSLPLLTQLIGQKTAESIKQQVENPEQPVSPGKRKGQLGVLKFKG